MYGKSPSQIKSQNLRSRHAEEFFRKKKKQDPISKKIKKILILLMILAFTVLAIYSIFFSSFFLIQEITIEKSELENENFAIKIKNSLNKSLGENIVFANTSELETKILKTFPELETVQVNKDYPQTLVIVFSKYPIAANVINKSNSVKKSYIINSIGYTVKEDYENPALPYITIESEEPINAKTTVITPSRLNYILDTIQYFEDKFGIKVRETIYHKVAREIHLITEKDFQIWLDIQIPAEDQLKKLKKALVKLDIYNEALSYIDLRISGSNGEKIIYKRR
jgi:hypothetical protein